MTYDLYALCFDANDPRRLARFWGGLLGWEIGDRSGDDVVLLPNDDTGFRLRFLASGEQKTGQNRMHFDLTSNLASQQQTVATALDLGARHVDVGQLPEEGHVVLADPEVNGSIVLVEEPESGGVPQSGHIVMLDPEGNESCLD